MIGMIGMIDMIDMIDLGSAGTFELTPAPRGPTTEIPPCIALT
jgi:hypothetical protein